MKIAVYHNLPSGGAKRSLYEFIVRTSSRYEYSLYRPDIEANEEYMDLRKVIRETHANGFVGLSADMLVNKSLVSQRKILKKFYKLEAEIAQQINNSDADVVFVMSCMFTHSPSLLALLKKPVLYYLQEPRRQSFEYNLSPLMQKMTAINKASDVLGYFARYAMQISAVSRDMQAVRSATRVFCNSYFSHEAILRNYGVDAEVCYLGVDQSFAADKRKHTTDIKSVLMVGALHPNKNQLLMLEALGLMSQNKRLRLECVFDRYEDTYKRHLLARANELGVDLILSHRITDAQLIEKYNSSVAVACFAELEPFGFTPLEANLSGTPVLALREGGYRETVIDGVTGIFVDRNPHKVSTALVSLMGGKWSLKKLQEHATQWSWQESIDRYEKAVTELARG